ncbi:hypothetical protein [Pontibacter roseus]|uniref:hypothetical protein n=1 Tax=Pontibacter roseus TaxID=336989 RepID=UPI00035D7209|nr:hypothetical protein [Pontibacter roseus]
MKKTFCLLVGMLWLLCSCKSDAPLPEVPLEDFFVAFVVDGKEKVLITQRLNPEVQVHAQTSITPRTSPELSKLQYRTVIGNYQSGAAFDFTHSTDKQIWQQGGEYADGFLQYIRKQVLSAPVSFAPANDTRGLAITFEFGDSRMGGFRSILLKEVNGVISPVPADQQNSTFVITRHEKIKVKDLHYGSFNSEMIEGTFNMKLYSHEGAITITDGKFKMFLTM